MPQHSKEEIDDRWKRLEPQLREIIHQRKSAASKRPWARTLAVAASVTLLAVGGVMAYLWTAQVTIQTAGGKTRVLVLPDQTTITLNENARVTYHPYFFSWRGERPVTLKGEAFFEVTRNPAQPFVITSPHFKTRVLGTSFSIKDEQNLHTPVLTVRDGKVQITDRVSGQQRVVTKDERAWLKDQQLLEEPIANHNAFAWKTGILTFDQQDMQTVLHTLSTYYKTKITVTDQRILRAHFTGSFDHASLTEALENLSFTMRLAYTLHDHQVIISPKANYTP